jgi:hypothetical protein
MAFFRTYASVGPIVPERRRKLSLLVEDSLAIVTGVRTASVFLGIS